jgi:hypothetical protein
MTAAGNNGQHVSGRSFSGAMLDDGKNPDLPGHVLWLRPGRRLDEALAGS